MGKGCATIRSGKSTLYGVVIETSLVEFFVGAGYHYLSTAPLCCRGLYSRNSFGAIDSYIFRNTCPSERRDFFRLNGNDLLVSANITTSIFGYPRIDKFSKFAFGIFFFFMRGRNRSSSTIISSGKRYLSGYCFTFFDTYILRQSTYKCRRSFICYANSLSISKRLVTSVGSYKNAFDSISIVAIAFNTFFFLKGNCRSTPPCNCRQYYRWDRLLTRKRKMIRE